MSRQYIAAGGIVQSVLSGKSLKGYCAASNKIGKMDYALALETLKYEKVLRKVFANSGIRPNDLDVNEGVLLVMSYELLFGFGKIKGGGKVKKVCSTMHPQLKKSLEYLMKSQGARSHTDLLPKAVQLHNKLDLFIRVNEAKVSMQDALNYVRNVCPEAETDNLIPSLIKIPAKFSVKASFSSDSWVMDGSLVIQDKASCFPSQILSDEWMGGDVLDCCSAPGQKTSHIAACLSKNEANIPIPTIFAFDKDKKRTELLKRRMKLMEVNSFVRAMQQDFLTIDENAAPFNQVTAILLDPSCSGSGVIRALDRITVGGIVDLNSDSLNNADLESRLKSLQSFQIAALLKALSFPNVDTVVYSTCSVHMEENEHVVASVLQELRSQYADDEKAHSASDEGNDLTNEFTRWKLAAPQRFRKWSRRGMVMIPSLSEEESSCLIRCSPEDGMNGFFVALFRRKRSDKRGNINRSSELHNTERTHQSKAIGGLVSNDGEHHEDVKQEKYILTEEKSKKRPIAAPTSRSDTFMGAKRFKVSKAVIKKFKSKKTQK